MSNINVRWLSVLVLSLALSASAVEAAGRGGGGRGGGGGHGGGGHGGGGAHFGGGGHIGGGAHVGGFRGGGAHFAGGARHVGGHAIGGSGRAAAFSRAAGGSSFRGNHAVETHNFETHNGAGRLSERQAAVHTNAIHHALAGAAVAGALHNHHALNNPASRARIAAAAATAGWQGHGRHGGWWRHAHGGYGWVGPLFWPFAFYDLSDYAMWGYDPSLWDYGYGDIYAGLFAPYGYSDLTGYLPSTGAASGGAAAPNDQLAQMCGEDSQDIAGLPIDRIQQALSPNDEQRKALDDLANASVQAAQAIKAACPKDVVSTAPARLVAMQTRLEAMISAVKIVQPPLDHFYGLLNDEQKTRLTALGQDQRRGRERDSVLAQNCGQGQAGAADWPAAEIEQRVHPTDAQRASFDNLKEANAKAADMLKGTCEPNETLTPPARLSAAGRRLDAMLQAVDTVKSAVDDLYAELSDEQKAQFEAIGPARDVAQASASLDEGGPVSRRTRHRHHASVVGMVRRLIGF